MPLNFSKYRSDDAARNFYEQVMQKLEHQPGILGVAANSGAPLGPGMPFRMGFSIEGRTSQNPQSKPQASGAIGTPAAFRLLGVPLISGRFFTQDDGPNAAPVIIISQGLARHYFSDEDPVGRHIRLERDDKKRSFTIVGVVGDVKQYALDKDPVDTMYLPFAQEPASGTLMIKTVGDPMNYIKQLRETVYSVDPDQPITDIKTLDELRGDSLAGERLSSILLGLFAMLALAIAATGLSAVTALLVSQRTREIGIRLALGAQRSQVLGMVMLQGMRLIVTGLAVGLAGALIASRVMQSFLFKTTVTDPLTFAGVALVLLAVALLASYIPARRVTRVDPMVALRTE